MQEIYIAAAIIFIISFIVFFKEKHKERNDAFDDIRRRADDSER